MNQSCVIYHAHFGMRRVLRCSVSFVYTRRLILNTGPPPADFILPALIMDTKQSINMVH